MLEALFMHHVPSITESQHATWQRQAEQDTRASALLRRLLSSSPSAPIIKQESHETAGPELGTTAAAGGAGEGGGGGSMGRAAAGGMAEVPAWLEAEMGEELLLQEGEGEGESAGERGGGSGERKGKEASGVGEGAGAGVGTGAGAGSGEGQGRMGRYVPEEVWGVVWEWDRQFGLGWLLRQAFGASALEGLIHAQVSEGPFPLRFLESGC
ncbi:unnamed protein product [Closterium sp. Yama58-4]|nr:unnamed protein product [Closterium sp. Yama58-4]